MALVEVRINDGVGVAMRGDTLSVVYEAPARLHRSRFIFDAADRLAAQNEDGILTIMIILPTADLPDAATRAENTARLRKLGSRLRRLVTVPVGDLLRVRLVRTIMRGLSIVHGHSDRHVIVSTVDVGLARLLEAAGPKTPSRAELSADLRQVCRGLGIESLSIGREAVAQPHVR